jgi:hypothetical protein
VGGLQSDSVVLDGAARRVFPEVQLIPYEEALDRALQKLRPADLERVWEGMGRPVVNLKHEGFFVDFRRTQVHAPPKSIYRIIASLGGSNGWLYADWLWKLRGRLDRLINPRRSAASQTSSHEPLQVGDVIDYYRVEALEPDRMMRLHSLLRAPGEGWMEWRIEDDVLQQTAFFAPRGLPGFLYWYLLGPLHRLVFRGLLREMKRRSEGA